MQDELTRFSKGKTVEKIVVRPFQSGFDGAMEGLLIRFTDTTAIILRAGSYIIPEESCIYAETSL